MVAPAAAAPLKAPTDLRSDGKPNPIAVSARPHLTWQIPVSDEPVETQAWQVIVASSAELLAEDKGDLWDSGRSPAIRAFGVHYMGKELKAGSICHWKVRWWSKDENPSPWSEAARWETAPYSAEGWHGAKWMNDGKANPDKDEDFYKPDPAPLMRKEFSVDKPVTRARLHVAGLGLSIPSINGERIEDHVFDPPWTRFDKRIFYRTHDLTKKIKKGDNCLGIALGNGWYNPLPLRMWGRRNLREALPVGRPRALACLVIDHPDGTQTTVTSNGDWKTTEGPTIRNSIYLGEERDARLEINDWDTANFDDSEWKPVKTTDDTLETLQPLHMPPVRLKEAVAAKQITEPEDGTYIVDFGINTTGIPEIKINAPEGTKITFRFGELIHEDGSLNPMTSVCGQIKGTKTLEDGTVQSVGGPGAPAIAWQQDIYIASGEGAEIYRPDFTYHGFRYMEVKGLAKTPRLTDFTLYPLHTDLQTRGTFECSNDHLNKIQEVCLRTFLANVITVQSDCPHRERFGYGGDIVSTSGAYIMNYDMSGFYAKTVRDWADSVLPDGRLTDTAPFVGVDYCGVGWAMIHPQLVEQLYQYYGNKQIIEEQLPVASKWLSVVAEQRKDDLVMGGLGDHEALTKERAKGPHLSTPMFINTCKRMARLARIVGKNEDAERFDQWATESSTAWAKKFLDQESGIVEDGSQTNQCFALGFNSAPEEMEAKIFNQLVNDLTAPEDSPRLSTGIYGTWILLEELSKRGRADLAYGLADRKTFPSWHWMIENGATTLWEHWAGSDGTFSQNHPMFGSISEWYFRWLGGIQCDEDAIAMDRITISPQIVGDLKWVRSSYDAPRGKITSNWSKDGDETKFEISIPADTKALVKLPVSKGANIITLNGKPISDTNPVESGTYTTNLGSGSYEFLIK